MIGDLLGRIVSGIFGFLFGNVIGIIFLIFIGLTIADTILNG